MSTLKKEMLYLKIDQYPKKDQVVVDNVRISPAKIIISLSRFYFYQISNDL